MTVEKMNAQLAVIQCIGTQSDVAYGMIVLEQLF